MKAMLLAAGEGTRFRPHTLQVPKPALPFLNVPLGYYFFPFLKSVGVKELIVNTFHLPHIIEGLYHAQSQFQINFSRESGKILGSGGGLEKAKDHFLKEENFLLLNADEIFIPFDEEFLKRLHDQHILKKAISTLLVMEHPEVGTKFGGIWVDEKEHVVGFGKVRPSNAKKGYHFLGVQMLNPSIFEFLPTGLESNILYDGLNAAIKKGHKVEIFKTSGHWYETGNLHDYLAATRSVLLGLSQSLKEFTQIKRFLLQMAPESRLEIINEALVWKDQSAKLTDVKFMNFAVVGRKAEIKNTQLSGCVVSDLVQVKSAFVKDELVLF